MPRVTLTVEGLDSRGLDGDEFPASVSASADWPADMTMESAEARLVDLSRAILTLLTYSPHLVADSFPGGEY